MVSPREVRTFAEAHTARLLRAGLRADAVAWDGAAHCAMLRTDPRGYARTVRAFCEGLVQQSGLRGGASRAQGD